MLILHVMCCSEIDDGELWDSSAISKRTGSHVIVTESGSQYLLLGNLDVARARQCGQLVTYTVIVFM